ncbi:hypothetical protein D8674_010455 [Pyrus ussuriensis x Pyrus communis]|uniref:Uncharacterized protein n=1 Tax=Pyrus ussuriensis x Pyrus communis TaxID=2448454 RepID=A0A5N5FPJ4_9ROSA|nr:hypothetical protein D8674_010455 [Pyrus ussuriensis x Pyrus communis]
MANGDARSSKTMDGEGSGKDKKKRAEVLVRHTYGGSCYRITAEELIGVVKSDERASFWSDVGALVHVKCVVDWESWRAIPEELKMHMIDELAPNWDIDKCNPNLMKAIDNMFKSHFQEWKFDNHCVHYYDLMNLDANQTQYINNLCACRFTQWKSDLHKHYELFYSPEVGLAVGKKCRQTRSIGRRRNFFTGPAHDASLIGWKSNVRGVKVSEIDMFKEVYVRPGDELTEQLHLSYSTFECSTGAWESPPSEPSASSYRQIIEEVKTLTSEVADQNERIATQQSQIAAQTNLMNQIFPDVEPPPEMTSQPPDIVAPPVGDCDVAGYLF